MAGGERKVQEAGDTEKVTRGKWKGKCDKEEVEEGGLGEMTLNRWFSERVKD